LNAHLQKFAGDEQAMLLLSEVYEKQAHPKDAVALLTGYITHQTDSLNAEIELGLAYLIAGDKQAAAAHF
jgi:hypothetical protein